MKGNPVKQINPTNGMVTKDIHEVDILIKLLPYLEVPLHISSKVNKDSNILRKLLNIAKCEAEMI